MRVKPQKYLQVQGLSGFPGGKTRQRKRRGESGKTRYISDVRELIGRNLRCFILAAAAGAVLRLICIFYFPGVTTDSFVYGDIAKNWLLHGTFGLSGTTVSPTDIRLPGYPGFLALIFAIFGMEHYRAVLFAQLLVDLGTCLICADLARRMLGPRVAKLAFLLAALCPFFANYSGAALTETLEMFFTALTIDFAVQALQEVRLAAWIGTGIACAGAILLRPDGVLLLFAVEIYLIINLLIPKPMRGKPPAAHDSLRPFHFRAAVIVAAISLAPLVPWTLRNWHVLHQFEPLAPRYANEEGEFVPMGFNRWTKTWIADYVSVEDIYWAAPGSKIDVNDLPSRAFDNPLQRSETERVISEYNQTLRISPQLDKAFELLAKQRIRAHPARYYLGLPLLRIADMWLRPRTEMLPSDTRWWAFDDEPRWSALALGLGIVGLFYVVSAFAGWARARHLQLAGLLILFVVLRSLFLGSLENPEPRYTLEMYPVVILFAAAAWAGKNKERNAEVTAT